VREQGVVLEDRVDLAVVGRHSGHVPAGQLDRAGARLLEAGDHPQRRRLARARRPEQGEELALLDLQVDARNRPYLTVLLVEADQADVRRCSYSLKLAVFGG